MATTKIIKLKDNSFAWLENSKEIKSCLVNFADYKSYFLSFFTDSEKRENKNHDDDLILKIYQNDDKQFIAQTGNYIGNFRIGKNQVAITSRFSDIFLKRMLNFTNDIFLNDSSIKIDTSNTQNFFILDYMFIQTLKKVSLLDLPKSYATQKYHDMTLKGKVDISAFIRYDIPFVGKISSTSREQKQIQEIIDMLYVAVSIVKNRNGSLLNKINDIFIYLKEKKSKNPVTYEIIHKALNAKVLQNSIFTPYRRVLEYAKIIIENNSLQEKHNTQKEGLGFIVNVAELFEIYIIKLLQRNFNDWIVDSPKIEVYPNNFFSRKIIPDIVMRKGDKVIVFDTKYKTMNMYGKNQYGAGDVDRGDFFQINTYLSYYQNQGLDVILGGLLYPMKKFELYRCHSDTYFGNCKTKFIVDGINILDLNQDTDDFDELVKIENEFINRIRTYL